MKTITNHVLRNIFCTQIFLVFIFILFLSIRSDVNDKAFKIKAFLTADENVCNPFIKADKSKQQYRVTIDGESYPKTVPLFFNQSINFTYLNSIRQGLTPKLILTWNQLFGLHPYRHSFNKSCPVTNCELTNDHSRVEEADFVLVHMREMSGANLSNLAIRRPKFQRWIFVMYETPAHLSAGDYSNYDGFFNLTSTYRDDSDFSHYYDAGNGMMWRPNPLFNSSYDFYGDKRAFAAALISNCQAGHRLKYIREIERFVEVDLFGRCGRKCPEVLSNGTRARCRDVIGKEYKFYFAFENSVCEDYITEKFHDILNYNVVPVVFGGGKYDRFVPKSGYINVQDYKTPKDLADHLIYLDGNREAYNAYFKWKENIVFEKTWRGFSPLCNMCIHLHLEECTGIKKSIIEDIGSYWTEQSCRQI